MPSFYIYKDLKVKYIISLIVCLLPLLIVFVISEFSSTTFLIIWFLLLIGIVTVFDLIKVRRLNRLSKELDNCRVEEYVKTYEQLTINHPKKNDFLLSNLAVGYLNLGDFKRANALLNAIDIIPKKGINNINLRFVYINNLCAVSILLEDEKSAEAYLNQMHEILNNLAVKQPFKNANAYYYILNKMSLDILRGKKELKEEYYTLLLQTDNRMLAKVEANFGLGEFYEEKGEIEKAKLYYNFALNNGGSSFYTVRAKERLEVLN